MKTNKILKWMSLMIIAALVTTTSCSKMMDHDFLSGVTDDRIAELMEQEPERVLGFLAGAISTLGDYYSNHDAAHFMSLQLAGDLMTEDMIQHNTNWHYFDYDIRDGNNLGNYRRVTHTWNMMYAVISGVNQAIDFIDPETENPIMLNTLGQSLALRAFCYHILVQRFQHALTVNSEALGIPVILSTRDELQGTMSRFERVPVGEVYEQIEADLLRAIDLLGSARPSKDFINKAVAQGFLARVYMNMEKYPEAERLAAEARASFPIMDGATAGSYGYNDETNSEWMWGLKTTAENTYMFASFQSHIASDAAGYAGLGAFKSMDNRLYNQMGSADVRRNLHHMDPVEGVFYNLKFKDVNNWLMDNIYMRSSEMLLIQAEAQARQNNGSGAATTLMELMSKRDPNYSRTTATVEDIFLQKRLECWGEGVIFYDYRRMARDVDRAYTEPLNTHSVQLQQKGTSWRVIYQIPHSEIDNNDNISNTDQNPGSGEL
ncbi:MAG: RagB/SusD family nutrient uptake outer membrane protein [Bacteroidales bacterium]|nr:RagB/SusD family nutrient uptake outer membrane protein [Bacteroidales bacterium]